MSAFLAVHRAMNALKIEEASLQYYAEVCCGMVRRTTALFDALRSTAELRKDASQ